MIEAIYVPTWRRPTQHTVEQLPQKWRDITRLVVDERDRDMHEAAGYNTLLCDVQGQGPAIVREWICHHARDNGVEKYGVFDDDICSFAYTRLATEKDKYPQWNTRLEPEGFDVMFSVLDEWLDEFVTCGLDVRWNPPNERPYHQNFRQSASHFYNSRTLPLDKLDWNDIWAAEDFNVVLQLLTMGYQNRVATRYRTCPTPTQTPGGITDLRTVERHNESMRQLKAKFPRFVRLYEKKASSGEWGGITKLAAEISWKAAWKSSQEKRDDALEELFA